MGTGKLCHQKYGMPYDGEVEMCTLWYKHNIHLAGGELVCTMRTGRLDHPSDAHGAVSTLRFNFRALFCVLQHTPFYCWCQTNSKLHQWLSVFDDVGILEQ